MDRQQQALGSSATLSVLSAHAARLYYRFTTIVFGKFASE